MPKGVVLVEIDWKIRLLFKKRGMTPGQLTRAAGVSRATMSRIMRDHMPSDETLKRIAAVLEVSPEYLRGGYTLPVHLTEDDILTLADTRNLTFLRLVREAADRGLCPEDLRKLIDIIERHPG